jgi:hypothetical protein
MTFIVLAAGSCGVAKERMDSKEGMTCYDWSFVQNLCLSKKINPYS